MKIPRMYHIPCSYLAPSQFEWMCCEGAQTLTTHDPSWFHIPSQENLFIHPVHHTPSSRTNLYLWSSNTPWHCRLPKAWSDLPLKQLGNSGSHLFRSWHCTLLIPSMIKPGWHLNSTVSLKENKLLLSDTMTAFSTWGGVHLPSSTHWGGEPLQTPTSPSLLVQCKDGSPTRLKSFFPLSPVLQR